MEETLPRRHAGSATCCLFVLFLLALFSTISPYWLWHFGSSRSASIDNPTLSTGAFVTSASSAPVNCNFWPSCRLISHWNRIGDFNATLCTDSYFTLVGSYGFCSEENGTVQTPRRVVLIQFFSVGCTAILFLALFPTSCMDTSKRGKLAYGAAGLVVSGSLFAICAVALAVSFEYYQLLLGDGWYLPFTAVGGCDTATCLVLSNRTKMGWGPAFMGMVFVSICGLMLSICLCSIGRKAKREAYQEKKEEKFGKLHEESIDETLKYGHPYPYDQPLLA